MCFTYSECRRCGKESLCTGSCCCDDEDYCYYVAEHRYCKDYPKCGKCYEDLCVDCDYRFDCDVCHKTYCQDCEDSIHYCKYNPVVMAKIMILAHTCDNSSLLHEDYLPSDLLNILLKILEQ